MVLSAAGHTLGSVPRDDVVLVGRAVPRCNADLAGGRSVWTENTEIHLPGLERSASTIAHCWENKHSPSSHKRFLYLKYNENTV